MVSGTAGRSRKVAPDNAGAQTTFVLDKILAALSALGAIKPVNTLVVVAGLIGGYKVEIEAEALAR